MTALLFYAMSRSLRAIHVRSKKKKKKKRKSEHKPPLSSQDSDSPNHKTSVLISFILVPSAQKIGQRVTVRKAEKCVRPRGCPASSVISAAFLWVGWM